MDGGGGSEHVLTSGRERPFGGEVMAGRSVEARGASGVGKQAGAAVLLSQSVRGTAFTLEAAELFLWPHSVIS